MKTFNTTGICNPKKHYMVDLTQRLAQIKVMVDASSYAGRDLVFLETLVRDGVTVARHADYDDEGQTVTVAPGIKTTLVDASDNDHSAVATSSVTLTDTVSYTGLKPGKTAYVQVRALRQLGGTTYAGALTRTSKSIVKVAGSKAKAKAQSASTQSTGGALTVASI